MEKERKENNSHVALLTVIALLTMIVVVIGATFAFLASSVANENMANINASTEGGSDLLLINAGNDIEFVANEVNFAKDLPSLKDSTTASVVLQTSSSATSTHYYNIVLENIVNDFKYSSGACKSRKTTTSEVALNTYDACKEAGNDWTTTDGVSYKCLSDLNTVTGEMYNNQLGCTGYNYIWSSNHTPELVFDLYQLTGDYSEEGACTTAGNKWLNAENADACYAKIKTVDLTEIHSGNVTLVDNASISASSSAPAADRYYGELTLVNFDHNQIVNSNKSFVATLKVARKTV